MPEKTASACAVGNALLPHEDLPEPDQRLEGAGQVGVEQPDPSTLLMAAGWSRNRMMDCSEMLRDSLNSGYWLP